MTLKGNLIRIERAINIYPKNKSDLLHEIDVNNIPFKKLKQIVFPKKSDPLLYDGYKLKKGQINAINDFLDDKIIPNFKAFDYFLVCGGIYDWSGSAAE